MIKKTQDDHNMITLKDAEILTGKSLSTLRRLVKEKALKGEKRKMGKKETLFINRNELLKVMSDKYGHDAIHDHDQNMIKMESDEGKNKLIDYLEKEVERLKKEIEQTSQYFNRKIEFMESRIEEKNEEIKRLNEEMKALLRDARQKPKGIMGYLMERITK